MRPGRLDRILYVGPPNLEAREMIFRINFSKMAVNDDVDISALAIIVRSTTLAVLPQWWNWLCWLWFRRMDVLELRSYRYARMQLWTPWMKTLKCWMSVPAVSSSSKYKKLIFPFLFPDQTEAFRWCSASSQAANHTPGYQIVWAMER